MDSDTERAARRASPVEQRGTLRCGGAGGLGVSVGNFGYLKSAIPNKRLFSLHWPGVTQLSGGMLLGCLALCCFGEDPDCDHDARRTWAL